MNDRLWTHQSGRVGFTLCGWWKPGSVTAHTVGEGGSLVLVYTCAESRVLACPCPWVSHGHLSSHDPALPSREHLTPLRAHSRPGTSRSWWSSLPCDSSDPKFHPDHSLYRTSERETVTSKVLRKRTFPAVPWFVFFFWEIQHCVFLLDSYFEFRFCNSAYIRSLLLHHVGQTSKKYHLRLRGKCSLILKLGNKGCWACF